MPRRLVDLSITLGNDVAADPPPMRPKIAYTRHKESFEQIALFFPGLQQAELPDGEAWAIRACE